MPCDMPESNCQLSRVQAAVERISPQSPWVKTNNLQGVRVIRYQQAVLLEQSAHACHTLSASSDHAPLAAMKSPLLVFRLAGFWNFWRFPAPDTSGDNLSTGILQPYHCPATAGDTEINPKNKFRRVDHSIPMQSTNYYAIPR